MKKKILSLILTVAMLLTVMPMALAADEYSDVQGHWGEAAIDRWTQAGVAVGREEGTFAPDAPMTRGEAAQVLANLLRLKKEANISQYGDMDPSSSYYTAMAQCVAAGIFNGTSDTTMSPDSELTREQLFAIFARALGVQPVSSSSVIFADSDKVSDWALGYINALAELGAVRGVGNSELQPQADINRASVMSLLDQTISVYADTNGATVGESSGIVLVVADQVTVMGNVENLVVAGGSASVTGGSVTNASLVGSAALSVSGSAAVSVVMVSGEGAALNVSGQAAVGSVAVAASATGASVEVTGSATVNTVVTQANSVAISGNGTVNSAVVSGSNTVVNTTGTNLTVSAGATGVTQNGSAVSGGSTVETKPSTPTTPSNPTTPPVYIPNFYSVAFQYADGTSSNYTAMEYSAVQFPNVPCEEGQKVTWYENGTLVADTSNVIVTSNRTFTAVVGSDDFTAGNGTQAYPYLISNAKEFAAVFNYAGHDADHASGEFFKVVDGIATINAADILSAIDPSLKTECFAGYTGYPSYVNAFSGTLDGNNVTLHNFDIGNYYAFIYDINGGTIKNLNISVASTCNFILSRQIYNGTLEDIDISADGIVQTGNNYSPFVYEAHYSVIKGCNNYVSISGTYFAAFVGYWAQNTQFINCNNWGNLTGTYVGVLISNQSSDMNGGLVIENCNNYGVLYGSNKVGFMTGNPRNDSANDTFNAPYSENLTASITVNGVTYTGQAIAPVTLTAFAISSNGVITQTTDSNKGVDHYKAVYTGYAQQSAGIGGTLFINIYSNELKHTGTGTLESGFVSGCKMIDTKQASQDVLSACDGKWVESTEETNNYARYAIVTVSGVTYCVIEFANPTLTINTTATLVARAYDASGNMLTQVSVS